MWKSSLKNHNQTLIRDFWMVKIKPYFHNIMRKGVFFAIGLAIHFLNSNDHLQFSIFLCCECYWTSCMNCKNYNSLYIWCDSLQLDCNNYFSTTMQLSHNVMLMSFFIHSSKFNTWHYEDFWVTFWNIDIYYPLWLFILDDFKLWHMAQ